jgi:SAM-dependent methyltransferase
MLESLRRRQTLASFDYQWGELPEGDAMLSDPWFRENVDRILVEELLCVDREWFRGRRVLDAGCGIGRWTLGLLRLGCDVTAVDFSPRALEKLEKQMRILAPEAVAEGRLSTERVDLLDLPPALASRRFDLVYSFGVLHHTGDTARALANVAPLVKPDGLLFLYLYGSRSQTVATRLVLAALRAGLAPFPFRAKRTLLKAILPARDPHQAFDTFSPLLNDTYTHEKVEGWLRELGFRDITRTIDYTELYLRARRDPSSAHPLRPLPGRPYWFERYRRRPLPAADKALGA